MLTALRSQCVSGVSQNFSKMYKVCLKCPLQCNILNPHDDTQDHILSCTKLSQGGNPELNNIYGDIKEQSIITTVYLVLMDKRTHILQSLEDQLEPTGGNIPGLSVLSATAGGTGYTEKY